MTAERSTRRRDAWLVVGCVIGLVVWAVAFVALLAAIL